VPLILCGLAASAYAWAILGLALFRQSSLPGARVAFCVFHLAAAVDLHLEADSAVRAAGHVCRR